MVITLVVDSRLARWRITNLSKPWEEKKIMRGFPEVNIDFCRIDTLFWNSRAIATFIQIPWKAPPQKWSCITVPVWGASSQTVFRDLLRGKWVVSYFAVSFHDNLHLLSAPHPIGFLHPHTDTALRASDMERMREWKREERERERRRGSRREKGGRGREEERICALIYSSGEVNEKSAALHQIKYWYPPPLPPPAYPPQTTLWKIDF